MRAFLAAPVLTLLVAACGLVAEPPPELGVSNGTTLDVTIVVNGQVVAVAPPGGPTPDIDERKLPLLPWLVEARTASGRLLVSMNVLPGDVTSTVYPGGERSGRSGKLGRVDLSCGRLDIYAGPPALGPPPGPGVPGDCEP